MTSRTCFTSAGDHRDEVDSRRPQPGRSSKSSNSPSTRSAPGSISNRPSSKASTVTVTWTASPSAISSLAILCLRREAAVSRRRLRRMTTAGPVRSVSAFVRPFSQSVACPRHPSTATSAPEAVGRLTRPHGSERNGSARIRAFSGCAVPGDQPRKEDGRVARRCVSADGTADGGQRLRGGRGVRRRTSDAHGSGSGEHPERAMATEYEWLRVGARRTDRRARRERR